MVDAQAGNQVKSKSKKGITIIALVITIVVLLILISIAIELSLGDDGIIASAVKSRGATNASNIEMELKRKIVPIQMRGQKEGKSEKEIRDEVYAFLNTRTGDLNQLIIFYELPTKEDAIDIVMGEDTADLLKIDPIEDEQRLPMILKVNVTSNMKLPVANFPENCYVDWGDGVKTTSITPTTTGIQDIKIYGNFQKRNFGFRRDYTINSAYKLNGWGNKETISAKSVFEDPAIESFFNELIEIKDWGENNFGTLIFGDLKLKPKLESYATPRERSFENVKEVMGLFSGSKVRKIDPKLFASAPRLSIQMSTWYKCQNLQDPIPSSLFDTNVRLRTCVTTFANSNVTGEIPRNLFHNNKKLEMVAGDFANTQLTNYYPNEMFKTNTNLKVLWGPFYNSGRLQKFTLTNDLFKNNTALEQLWLANIQGQLPEYVLANAQDLKQVTFHYSKITGSIPENLFANNANLENLINLFKDTPITGPIPAKLFANNPKLKRVDGSFYGCESLQGPLPENLFVNNRALENMNSMFYGCSRLNGIGYEYWKSLPNLANKDNTWASSYLRCVSLSNYNMLPVNAKGKE